MRQEQVRELQKSSGRDGRLTSIRPVMASDADTGVTVLLGVLGVVVLAMLAVSWVIA